MRYIGSSNFAGWQIADADWTSRTNGWARMVSAQNNYSLLKRDVESEVIPACRRFGVGMLPFFPLASGVLTGKYKRGEEGPEGSRLGKGSPMAARAGMFLNDRNFDVVAELEKIAVGCGRVASPPRDGRARRAADGGIRDRGRHDSGAGAGERRGGILAASSRRRRRDRRGDQGIVLMPTSLTFEQHLDALGSLGYRAVGGRGGGRDRCRRSHLSGMDGE